MGESIAVRYMLKSIGKNTKSDKVQMVARKLLVDRKEKAECK